MSSKLNFGLLGCGRVSQRYFEVFKNEISDVANIVAVCDLIPEKMTRFEDQFGAVACENIQQLCAQNIDIVCILSESGNHFEHAKEVMENGKHVIIEKPIAMRLEHADELNEIAQKHNVKCGVIKQNRFNPAIRFAKNAIEQGRFGKIQFCSVRVHWCREQSYYEDGWHGTWKMDGGVLNQQAIHHLDAVNWLAGPVEAVCAHGTRLQNTLEAEDSAVASLKLAGGAVGTIEATTAARPRDIEASLTIVGSDAYLKIGGIALNEIEVWAPVSPIAGDENVITSFSQEVPSGYGLGHGPILREVIKAVQNDMAMPVDVAEGRKALSFVHALYRSMENNGWVELKDNPSSLKLGL